MFNDSVEGFPFRLQLALTLVVLIINWVTHFKVYIDGSLVSIFSLSLFLSSLNAMHGGKRLMLLFQGNLVWVFS